MSTIPATVLTGYLGSGKTTVLNHVLTRQHEKTLAVIINEFGNVGIGIDGQLMVSSDENLVELNNGCICCTVRGDLIRTIDGLMSSGKTFDHVMIETTGLADPAPIIRSFVLEESLATRLQLDAIVTVVDSRHIMAQLAGGQAREQVAFADVILLNKTDLVSESEIEEVALSVRGLNPFARIRRTRLGEIDVDAVLNVGAFDLRKVLRLDPMLLLDDSHQHDQDIGCVAISEPGVTHDGDLMRWLNQLVQAHGKDLLRIRGGHQSRRRGSALRLPRSSHDPRRPAWNIVAEQRDANESGGVYRSKSRRGDAASWIRRLYQVRLITYSA